jgi:signal transduction histidine kinase
LLRELGERLVGRPHIALAELIKNAYDADARTVEIVFRDDEIVIADDGHGMSHADFVERWMRIGTGRKEKTGRTPELRRAMTGSKGVGRLAAQLLANQLELTTVALRNPELQGIRRRRNATTQQLHEPVHARVRWDELTPVTRKRASSDDADLDRVPVRVRLGDASVPELPHSSRCGTQVVLRGLTVEWDEHRFRSLAEQLWALEPPFESDDDVPDKFTIVLRSPFPGIVEEFKEQMRAVLDIWIARVSGQLLPERSKLGKARDTRFNVLRDLKPPAGDITRPDDELKTIFGSDAPQKAPTRLVRLEVEFRSGEKRKITVEIPHFAMHQLEFEIRVFKLEGRQLKKITVKEARGYLNRFGGVHIHDGSFRLPYYGPDQDWLAIEQDHAHRLSKSRLLPDALQTKGGLEDLPTNSRLYGSVNVSTSTELSLSNAAGWEPSKALALQVTRDRLVDNVAFRQLKAIVRLAVDFYATESARNKVRDFNPRQPGESAVASIEAARTTIVRARDAIPAETYNELSSAISVALVDARKIEESARAHLGMLGALATAGITSLAYEHESQKQFVALADVADRLEDLADTLAGDAAATVRKLAVDTRNVLSGAERLRRVFSPLLEEETREGTSPVKAHDLVQSVASDLTILARGTEVDTNIDRDLVLPGGSYPAWSAIVQNLLINGFNALLDRDRKVICVDDGRTSGRRWIRFQDTGAGVDLDRAETYFQPFVRGEPGSPERAALGLGGSGLGLTIVRMIAAEFGCRVSFRKPADGFGTAVYVDWKELDS